MTESLSAAKLTRKTATAALVLAAHALFVLLIQIERGMKPRRFPVPPAIAGIAIQLHPVAPVVPLRPDETGARRQSQPVAPAPKVATPITTPVYAEDAPSVAVPERRPPVDWYAQAAALAARHAEKAEESPTFSPPPKVMRQPCRPRTQFDKATREKMAELQPPDSDPIPLGGFRASSVNMGGVIVRERPLPGGARQGDDAGDSKRSFKWKWESKNDTGISWLTLGWEPNPPYDGMFDDMQAGKTPESSVPHHETCD